MSRTKLISVPDLEPFKNNITSSVIDGKLQNASVNTPVTLTRDLRSICPEQGLTSSFFVRCVSHLLQRARDRGVVFQGPDTDAIIKDIIENEMTPLANKPYVPYAELNQPN